MDKFNSENILVFVNFVTSYMSKLNLRFNRRAIYLSISMILIITLLWHLYLISFNIIIPNNFNYTNSNWSIFKSILYFNCFAIAIFSLYVMGIESTNFIQNYILYPLILLLYLLFLNNITGSVTLLSAIIYTLPILFLFLYYYMHLNKSSVNPNWIIIFTIIFSLFLLNVGLTFINAYTGETIVDYDVRKGIVNHIHCYGISNHLIANEYATCIITPSISNTTFYGKIQYLYVNGSIETWNFNQTIGFIVPEHLAQIKFIINSSTGSVIIPIEARFPNYQEFNENKITFMNYLLALLGFIVISVPFIVEKYYGLIKKYNLDDIQKSR